MNDSIKAIDAISRIVVRALAKDFNAMTIDNKLKFCKESYEVLYNVESIAARKIGLYAHQARTTIKSLDTNESFPMKDSMDVINEQVKALEEMIDNVPKGDSDNGDE